VRVVRQPRQPAAAPPSRDLGDEPPAVVNLLVRDFDPTREALPATLLDLAARGVVAVEHLGADTYQVRLRADDQRLRPFEERLLGLLRSRARGGVVPAAALTAGPNERAHRWWKDFRGAVIDEAQARGLSEDIWSRRVVASLALAAVPAAPLWALAFFAWGPIVLYALAILTVLGTAQGGRRQRHTDAGLGACARWLGVRRELRTGSFEDLPPSAVEVWERYLGYAAAMGLARRAVRAIPIGADLDHRAWSAYGGRWREVRVRYPRLLPPGYGSRPAFVVPIALGLLVIASFPLRIAAGIGWPSPDPFDPSSMLFAWTFFGAFLVVGLVMAAGALTALLAALGDLGRSREVRGEVVRLRRRGDRDRPEHYIAVDEGTNDRLRAWRVSPALIAGIGEGDEVAVTVSPNLGHVSAVRRL